MPRPAGLVMSMPTHRVHHRQAAEELAHLISGLWPYNKMPVIWHRHHRENRQWNDLPGLVHRPNEGQIVFRLLKNREPCHSSIEHMEDFTSGAVSFCSWHHAIIPQTSTKIMRPDPFCVSLFPFCVSLFVSPFLCLPFCVSRFVSPVLCLFFLTREHVILRSNMKSSFLRQRSDAASVVAFSHKTRFTVLCSLL